MMRSPLRKGGQLARCDAGRERGHADAEHLGGLAQRDEGAGLGALDRGHGVLLRLIACSETDVWAVAARIHVGRAFGFGPPDRLGLANLRARSGRRA